MRDPTDQLVEQLNSWLEMHDWYPSVKAMKSEYRRPAGDGCCGADGGWNVEPRADSLQVVMRGATNEQVDDISHSIVKAWKDRLIGRWWATERNSFDREATEFNYWLWFAP